MSTSFVLNAEKRADVGKGASRRLRHAGKVPAVIYGGDKEAESLVVNHNELIKHLENEAFYSSILKVQIGGSTEQAILRDLQRHVSKPKIVHLDLQRVSASEKLHMHVPLHFIGEDKAPGVKAGGIISHSMTDIEVSCLPQDLPEFLEIDVSKMEMDDVIHISDIKLPAGVSSVALSHGEDHDLPVVAIHKTRATATEEEAGAPEAPAAPEVVGKEGEGESEA